MPHAASDVRESVFLNQMPSYDEALCFPEITERWNKQFALRDDVMKALELARAEKLIGKSLDAKITIYTENEEIYKLLESFGDELPTVYIVSGASIVLGKTPDGVFAETESGIGVKVEGADGEKCARCWSYSTKGTQDEEGGFLCDKCKAIIEA